MSVIFCLCVVRIADGRTHLGGTPCKWIVIASISDSPEGFRVVGYTVTDVRAEVVSGLEVRLSLTPSVQPMLWCMG